MKEIFIFRQSNKNFAAFVNERSKSSIYLRCEQDYISNKQVEGTTISNAPRQIKVYMHAALLENQTSFSSLESKYRDCYLKIEAYSTELNVSKK